MIVKLKEGDSLVEVDTEFTDDMIDTFDNELNSAENNDLEDTIDIKMMMEKDNASGEN